MSLPYVFRVKRFEDLSTTIRFTLKLKTDFIELENFIQIIDKNSFEFDVFEISGLFLKRFHSEGFMVNSKISMDKLLMNSWMKIKKFLKIIVMSA